MNCRFMLWLVSVTRMKKQRRPKPTTHGHFDASQTLHLRVQSSKRTWDLVGRFQV
jgi:hypothetical protein